MRPPAENTLLTSPFATHVSSGVSLTAAAASGIAPTTPPARRATTAMTARTNRERGHFGSNTECPQRGGAGRRGGARQAGGLPSRGWGMLGGLGAGASPLGGPVAAGPAVPPADGSAHGD